MESVQVLVPESQVRVDPPSLVGVAMRRRTRQALASHVLRLKKETVRELAFEILGESHWRSVAEFLLANFFPQVPIAEVVGMDADVEVRPWLGEFVRNVLAYPISIGVRNASGQLVAVCFNLIETATQRLENRPLPNMSDYISPEKHPVMCMNMAFVEKLSETFYFDTAFNIFMLSVSSSYGQRGLARALIQLSTLLASELGIDTVVSQAVNYYAARAFESCGFFCAKQLCFDDFEYEGELPLANCSVHQAGKLMVLHLPFI